MEPCIRSECLRMYSVDLLVTCLLYNNVLFYCYYFALDGIFGRCLSLQSEEYDLATILQR